MIGKFTLYSPPAVIFGGGTIHKLEEILAGKKYSHLVIITGNTSYDKMQSAQETVDILRSKSETFSHFRLSGEPSVDFIDTTAEEIKKAGKPDFIISIGGGSVIDSGKAVSALLTVDGSIQDYLEGVGTKEHPGTKIPFIAIPTTSGTGAEATKNAVISKIGPDGFKKSLRHDNFVPDYVIIDPELTIPCPKNITAASGLDAITQLLGAYVSTKATSITDALAEEGLKHAGRYFERAASKSSDYDAREGMAYAAYLSGICLANAGLGVVHGIASPMGAHFDIPHGVVCGTLLASAIKINVYKMLQNEPESPALKKYSKAAGFLSENAIKDDAENCNILIETISKWIEKFSIPKLSEYGITTESIDQIVKESGNKNNPVDLEAEDIKQIIMSRL